MENVYVLNNTVCETPVEERTLWNRFKNYMRENALMITSGLRFASGNYTINYWDYQNLSLNR